MIQAAYIHIPFCEHICHYCDFNKVFLEGQPVNEYLECLEKEIVLTKKLHPMTSFHSIFVGGGTPTALDEQQLERLCTLISNHLPAQSTTEFTFEANPGELSENKLRILKNAGVNRLSFGVQTFNDALLEKIGRTHRAKDVFQTIELARKVGFSNISIDLIYSLPGQTLDDFYQTLKTAFTLEAVHYSGYSLIIEPKTVFYNLMRKGQLATPGEDTEAAMYELLMEEMDKQGFHQYEISNFSKPGYESKHNLCYWNNEEYFGFGAGAHSYVNGHRQANYGPLKKYMEPIKQGDLPLLETNLVTVDEKMEEEMFLGLRKTQGISVRHFEGKFGQNPLQIFNEQITELKAKHLIEVNNGMVSLTRKGKLLGNEVFQSFLK